MSDTMTIRDVAASDYEPWLTLWNGYNAFYGRSGPTALPAEVTQTTWQRFFDAREPVYALVAELDGSLIGLTHYLFHRSTTLIAPICYLQDLYTAPERRRTGVGRALIEALVERAAAAGKRVMVAVVDAENVGSVRFHERCGFIEVARMPDIGFKFGRWLTLVLLQRRVDGTRLGENNVSER